MEYRNNLQSTCYDFFSTVTFSYFLIGKVNKKKLKVQNLNVNIVRRLSIQFFVIQ
jgi:hypothetical protein